LNVAFYFSNLSSGLTLSLVVIVPSYWKVALGRLARLNHLHLFHASRSTGLVVFWHRSWAA